MDIQYLQLTVRCTTFAQFEGIGTACDHRMSIEDVTGTYLSPELLSCQLLRPKSRMKDVADFIALPKPGSAYGDTIIRDRKVRRLLAEADHTFDQFDLSARQRVGQFAPVLHRLGPAKHIPQTRDFIRLCGA